MENEKKVNEKELNVTESVKENGKKTERKTVYVERESFEGSNGEEYWSYVVKGKVRGRDVKVDFIPKDKGGYEPLDIVFDVNDKAELLMADEAMTDNNGNVTRYISYLVRTVDEDGLPYECAVKPARDSDKALLKMLLNALGI